MTVPASPATVTLTVPVHPTPEQYLVLLQRAQLQERVRQAFWTGLRSGLGTADAAQTWAQPRVLLPAIAQCLYGLTPSSDQEGRVYIDDTLMLEVGRLRGLPARVDHEALQPNCGAEQVSVPAPLTVIGHDTILLPDLALEVGFYALPQPFRSVLLHAGAQWQRACRERLQSDFTTWDREWREVSAPVARQFELHAEQAGRWCPEPAEVPPTVPGVKLTGALLDCRPDRAGDRHWACDLTFSVSAEAVRTWFPQAHLTEPVGIDPGLQRPLTWASAGTGESLSPALVDLAGFPGSRGPGARTLRQAVWERHAAGYDRVWGEVFRHCLIRIEDTHWITMADKNPDFSARAQDNFLWSWLDHLIALAPLTGSSVELIASRDTSCTCSECGYLNAERQQLTFKCTNPKKCPYSAPVDVNAALNIAQAMVSRQELATQDEVLRRSA